MTGTWIPWRGERGIRRRDIALLLTALLVVATLVTGLVWLHWVYREYRLAEVTDGRLYQSAEMPPDALRSLVSKHGIRMVVDLRQEMEGDLKPTDERRVLEDLGVAYLHLPSEQIPSDEVIDEFLLAAADPMNHPMLVHCHHGEGRSVLAAAIYRIEFESWDVERARAKAKMLSFRGSFGPRGEKGEFLRRYVRRRPEHDGLDHPTPLPDGAGR